MSTRNDHRAHAVDDTKLTVLVDSVPGATAVAKALGDPHPHIRVLAGCGHDAARARYLLVVSTASKLAEVAECVSVANKAHRLAALVVHNDVDANWLPYVFHHSGLRVLRNVLVHSDPELPTRILSAWAMGGEHDFIADATVIRDRLVVRSCAFEEFSVPFEVFPALAAIPTSARSAFVLQDDGFLLYWPDFDVHLDLDDIRFANDPTRQHAARAEQMGDQHAIGAALRFLREEAGLKQSDLVGISERQVRRVESGHRLTTDTLDAFAMALRVDPGDLLERIGELMGRDEHSGRPTSALGASTGVVKRGDDRVLRYPSSPGVRSLSSGGITAEPLSLAAESSEATTARSWDVGLPGSGSIRGFLEYDFRSDKLFFVVKEVSDPKQEIQVVIVAWSPRFTEPLMSEAFHPRPGGRALVASDRGIVPRDVSRLELRAVNEP